ncbi:MAG: hypothetical protein Q9187_006829 [Circinaria calcarea]
MASSGMWKSIVFPPLVAFLIYLVSIYIFLPLYRKRTRYAQYLPLPIAPFASSSNRPSLVSRIRDRLSGALSAFSRGNNWQRRQSQATDDSLFDDEELEEGIGMDGLEDDTGPGNPAVERDRRLSRDLEVGFRDDSDDEDGHGRREGEGRRE